jgi:hypothetical protein
MSKKNYLRLFKKQETIYEFLLRQENEIGQFKKEYVDLLEVLRNDYKEKKVALIREFNLNNIKLKNKHKLEYDYKFRKDQNKDTDNKDFKKRILEHRKKDGNSKKKCVEIADILLNEIETIVIDDTQPCTSSIANRLQVINENDSDVEIIDSIEFNRNLKTKSSKNTIYDEDIFTDQE